MLARTNLLITMILLWSMMGSIQSQCTEGCLKCQRKEDGSAFCEVCDVYSSFYKTEAGICKRKEIENCLIPSVDQKKYLCAQCKQLHVLDSQQQKCVEVPTAAQIQNCRQYTLVGTCNQCYEHYYLKDNTCNRASVIIENCFSYFNDDLCLHCKNDFYFDVSSSKCVPFEAIENCSVHSRGECKECQAGYYLNKNPINMLKIDSNVMQQLTNYLWEGVNFNKYPRSVCLKMSDPHCIEESNGPQNGKINNSCVTCKSGFYLDANNKCTVNPLGVIEGCSIYGGTNWCLECTADLYLKDNQCNGRSTYPSCAVPVVDQNYCQTCNIDAYLNQSNICTDRSKIIPKCMTLTPNEDNCMECLADNTLTSDKLACLTSISDCLIYESRSISSDTKLACKECKSDLYLNGDKSICNAQTVEFCDTYRENSNICIKCDSTYYIENISNTCKKQDITNCEVHTSNLNECTDCKTLYYLKDNTTCQSITEQYCYANTKNKDECIKCKPNLILEDKTCKVTNDFKIVDFCKSNTNSNQKCSECDDSEATLIEFTESIKQMPANCATVEKNVCKTCLPQMNVFFDQKTNDYTCTSISISNNTCFHMKDGFNGFLSDNISTCQKCTDYDTHFLQFHSCLKRSPKITENCLNFNEDEDQCKTCDENYSGVSKSIASTPTCMTTLSGFTAIPDCEVHDAIDQTICNLCSWGFALTKDRTCEDTNVNEKFNIVIQNGFHYVNEELGKLEYVNNTGPYKNCKNVSRLNSKLYCTSCEDGYIPVANNLDFSSGAHIGAFSDFPSDITCHLRERFVKKETGYYFDYEQCELGKWASATQKYISCVKCKNGLNAKIIKATHNYDNSSLNVDVFTVSTCSSETGTILQKEFYGASYRPLSSVHSSIEFINLTLEYDTCTNNSHSLISLISTSPDRYNSNPIPGDEASTIGEVRHICTLMTGKENNVDNCQIYVSNVSTTPDDNINYVRNAKCFSCKPGYEATTFEDADKIYIKECEKIDNCNLTGNNTWMNACQNCESGFMHAYEGSINNKYINIGKCVNNSISDCLLQNDSKCYHCSLGYKIANNELSCTGLTAINNCQDLGFSFDSIDLSGIINTTPRYQNMTYEYIKNFYVNQSAKGACFVCSTGTQMALIDDTKDFLCTANAGLTLTEGKNCKYFSGTEANKCLTCEDKFIINNSNLCVAITEKHADCLIANNDNEGCFKCETNYEIESSSKMCKKYDHCLTYTTVDTELVCTSCSDNKMVDYRDRTKCVATIIKNCKTTRQSEDFLSYFCTECTATHRLTTFTIDSKVKSYCTTNIYSDTSFNNANLKFIVTSQTLTYDTAIANTEYYIDDEADQKQITKQMCAQLIIYKCKVYGNSHTTCTTCEDEFWYDEKSNHCVPNSITNCTEQKDLYECKTCNEAHYISLGQCLPHQVRFCTKYLSNKDGCDICNEGYYLSDEICYKNQVQNCKTYKLDANACAECNTDFYLNDAEMCKAYTVIGCKEFAPEADYCETCFDRHYKDVNNKCLSHTVTNCKVYEINADKCNGCEITDDATTVTGNYKFNNDKCEEFDVVDNCLNYNIKENDDNFGECSTCKENFMIIDKKCVATPTGVLFCKEYEDLSTCKKCKYEYYMDQGKCLPIGSPIQKCLEYSNTNLCSKCKNSYIVSTDKSKCNKITETSCLTYVTADSCATCASNENLIPQTRLDMDGTNKINVCEIVIAYCWVFAAVDIDEESTDDQGNTTTSTVSINTCTKCFKDYIPSEDGKTCKPNDTIDNCDFYGLDKKCAQCESNYVLDVDGLKCKLDLDLVGIGCKASYISKNVQCNICKDGFYLNSDGACTECGGTGCAICNANDTSACSLCKAGFYMNTSMKCNINSNFVFQLTKESIEGGDPVTGTPTEDDTGSPNDNTDNTDNPENPDRDSVNRITCLIMLLSTVTILLA